MSGVFVNLTFSLSSPSSPRFGPRLGNIVIRRHDKVNTIETPGLLTTTSRGVVPHLSHDHCNLTNAIRWIHVPFETFLEHTPPVPTLQTGSTPLHKFLGYLPSRHLVSMSVRDPYDGREMPPNGNAYISAMCIRGVRKVTSSDWRSYALACRPDIVIALSDTPFTAPPHSQKRLTKSIERSAAWLFDMLRPVDNATQRPFDVFVHMAGGISVPARRAFADSLNEILEGKDAKSVKPLKCLDEGVAGYTFDLVPIRDALLVDANSSKPPSSILSDIKPIETPILASQVDILLQSSLASVSQRKIRLVNSVTSPHEILRLIQQIGIDLFDAHWAQRAADIGIALDFVFPVTDLKEAGASSNGKRELGHNLFHSKYSQDFSRLAENFLDGCGADDHGERSTCPCAACSPSSPSSHILHSSIDCQSYSEVTNGDCILPPYTRAYLHHLLHTHEMSSYGLLVMHNLAVTDAFFVGIRAILALPDGLTEFAKEAQRFCEFYDEELTVFEEAKVFWTEVEMARGKGRLAREKAKQNNSMLGTVAEP